MDSITTSYGCSEIISDQTHILPGFSLSIDLIFTNQLNVVIEIGALLSLHPNCYHQIVFVKVNLKIEYPHLHERFIWDYKNANDQLINRAIESFNWEKSFEGKSGHDQVYLSNKIILNMFHHFILNKIIIRITKIHHGFI